MNRRDVLKQLAALPLVMNLFDEPVVFEGDKPFIILTVHESLGQDVEIDVESLKKQLSLAFGMMQAKRTVILYGFDVTVIDGNEVHTNRG